MNVLSEKISLVNRINLWASNARLTVVQSMIEHTLEQHDFQHHLEVLQNLCLLEADILAKLAEFDTDDAKDFVLDDLFKHYVKCSL